MGWRETNAEMERMKFIIALDEGKESMAELCRRFGISRQTGYLWKRRFEEGGPAALSDRPPLAHTHPNALDPQIADHIAALRKQHPRWGPKKLRALLAPLLTEEQALPAASTIGEVLKRRGLLAPRQRRLRVPPLQTNLADYTGPNAIWCIDHKGHFALSRTERCYPLTLQDGFSRYLLKLEALPSTKEALAQPHVERAFREFGLPVRIRSDGGKPFADAAVPGRLSRLAIWWVKLGIQLERIEGGHPEQNGRLERFHRTLEEAIPGTERTMEEQQRLFDAFRREYNHVRPHEALGQQPPSSSYETSWRAYPGHVGSPEYPHDTAVRRVQTTGCVQWRGHTIRLTKLLAHEPVFFEESGEESWNVRFGSVFLAHVDLRTESPRVSYARSSPEPEPEAP
jgi:transposase InsO family protein